MALSIAEFVNRWKINSLSELGGSQPHFIDLCDMLGQPHPAAADSVGDRYTFNKHLNRLRKGKGFADVWLRDHFAWEYKSKDKDLKAAYIQLADYREDLGNPPLLVVCDLDRFEVHTNFTATNKRVYAFNLDDLNRNQVTATCPLPPLEVLRALFGDTNVLRPDRTDAFVTQEAARLFSKLAERLEIERRAHSESPEASKEEIAHFLMRLLFCLFADSVGLLPDRVFRRLIEIDRFYPRRFLMKLPLLFQAMSEEDGFFGEHTIRWFNGGLFNGSSIIQLDKADMAILYDVAHKYDWSHIAPAIFGTLFERSLDPARRSLIGAHYTSEEDILLLIEPVLMRPLERRWEETRSAITSLPAEETRAGSGGSAGAANEAAGSNGGKISKRPTLLHSNRQAEELLAGFFDFLSSVRVLDPACGSGNFLYIALRRMLDLWKEARDFAVEHNIQLATKYAVEKMVSPSQIFGIETEFYAHELASIVVWIGFLQWKHEHGIIEDREPILQKLSNIEHDDAILRYDAEGKAYEPEWPRADVIIGNPPFLGGSKMLREIVIPEHPRYVQDLRNLYEGRVPGGADLVTYWFEKARSAIEMGECTRAGLVATQSVRMGSNRKVLSRINETCNIFFAWSDRPWLLDGADVRVSLIGFDSGQELFNELDGLHVEKIHDDLKGGQTDTTSAAVLGENKNRGFKGFEKNGRFEMSSDVARRMLGLPINPNNRPNSDVIRRWFNADDVTGRDRGMFIIDFGPERTKEEAAPYEIPFEWAKEHVLPKRATNNDLQRREKWWRFGRSGSDLRAALKNKSRVIVTPRVAKLPCFSVG